MPPLNVKDALGYLDSVKARFRSNPDVYNDFLDIMKDFKTQVIDTPGVIDRVSSLFSGHPTLIQGFNTFLPPGFRIECSPENADPENMTIIVTTPTGTSRLTNGMATNLTGINTNLHTARHHTGPARAPPPASTGTSPAPAAPAPAPPAATAAGTQQPPQPASTSRPPTTHGAPSTPSAARAPSRPPGEPSPMTDTKGQRPSELSTQQPWEQHEQKPQKSSPNTPQQRGPVSGRSSRYGSRAPSPASAAHAGASQQTSSQQPSQRSSQQQQPQAATQHQQQQQPQPQQPPSHSHPASSAHYGSGASTPSGGPAPPPPPQHVGTPTQQEGQRPPVEFNHAISFVNRIKNRFTSDPDIYKTFLEILQTYQKEQKAIQEVYAQVTALFRDAPDLLDEFKQFLPDTSSPSSGAPPGSGGPPAPSSASGPQMRYYHPDEQVPHGSNTSAEMGMGMLGQASVAQGRHIAEEEAAAAAAAAASSANNSTPPSQGPKRKAQNMGREDGSSSTGAGRPSKRGRKEAPASTGGDTSFDSNAPSSQGATGPGRGGGNRAKPGRKPGSGASAAAANAPSPSQPPPQQSMEGHPPPHHQQIPPPPPPHHHPYGTSGYPLPPGAEAPYVMSGPMADGSYRYEAPPPPPPPPRGRSGQQHTSAPTPPPPGLPPGPPQGMPPMGPIATSSMRHYPLPHQSGAPPPPPPPGAGYPPMTQGQAPIPPNAPSSMKPPAGPVSADEQKFFDRVSKYIDDRTTYHEFLKLLNLYTQEIIDLHQLVERAYLFIGNNHDLWSRFREMVKWKDGDIEGSKKTIVDGKWVIENIPVPDSLIKLSSSRARLQLHEKEQQETQQLQDAPSTNGHNQDKELPTSDKSYGPSYRMLPKSEQEMSCSGRDALCWKVLNDTMVSQPTWSDEGFLVHDKNPFELALHRSEEQRYEYDFYIEANARAIAYLEPIAARMTQIEPEKLGDFKLRNTPGQNPRSTVNQTILKKIYGRRHGQEVINALQDQPAVVLPIVLSRLKQKDEEWKRALKEWNRVWREVDSKNYLKALDHKGVELKSRDKKLINPKTLVSEIELIRREQLQKITRIKSASKLSKSLPSSYFYNNGDHAIDNNIGGDYDFNDDKNKNISSLTSSPTCQLEYDVNDLHALLDSLKLVLSFLDHHHPVDDKKDATNKSTSGSGGGNNAAGSSSFTAAANGAAQPSVAADSAANYTNRDRDRIERFLRTFICSFFDFRKEFLDDALKPVFDATDLSGANGSNGIDDDGNENSSNLDDLDGSSGQRGGRKRKEGVIVGPAGLVVIGGNSNIKRKPGRKPKNHPSYLEAALRVEKDANEYQTHLRRLARKAGRDHLAILDRLDPPFDRRDELGQFIEDVLGQPIPEDVNDAKLEEMCDAFIKDRSRKLHPDAFTGWADLDGFRTKAIGNAERVRERFMKIVGHLPQSPPRTVIEDIDLDEMPPETTTPDVKDKIIAHLAPLTDNTTAATSAVTTPEPDTDMAGTSRSPTPTPAGDGGTGNNVKDDDENGSTTGATLVAPTGEVASSTTPEDTPMAIDTPGEGGKNAPTATTSSKKDGLNGPSGEEIKTARKAASEAEVSATAGGLEAMEGVETVSAGGQDKDTGKITDGEDAMEIETKESESDTSQSEDLIQSLKPSSDKSTKSRRYNFFCDSKYYVLLRLIQVLYSRVLGLREQASRIIKSPWPDRNSLPECFQNKDFMKYHTLRPTEYYDTLLELTEMVFAGRMEPAHFEDAARAMFGLEAYKAYNIDRLVHAIVKQVHAIVDPNSPHHDPRKEILKMLLKDRASKTPYHSRQQLSYRAEAEAIIAAGEGGNFYRVEWDPGYGSGGGNSVFSVIVGGSSDERWTGNGKVHFQLLGQDEIFAEDEDALYDDWQEYMAAFSQPPADGFGKGKKGPWLRKSFTLENKNGKDTGNRKMRAWSGLEAKICMRSYKMFFVSGTEDSMIILSSSADKSHLKQARENRKQRFSNWLEKQPEQTSPSQQ